MKTFSKKQVFFGTLVVVCSAVGVWFLAGRTMRRGPQDGAATVNGTKVPASTSGGVVSAGATAKDAGLSKTNQVALSADQVAARKMNDFLDSESEQDALVVARQLMKSVDAEVRRDVVATLSWIGIKALPELSVMMNDKDTEVAQAAYTHWRQVLKEITEDSLKGEILVAGLLKFKKQDQLEDAVMAFTEVPDEIAIRCLVQLIQSDNPVASEVAREHYAFVTGDAYTTPQAAEIWIKGNSETKETPAPVTKK